MSMNNPLEVFNPAHVSDALAGYEACARRHGAALRLSEFRDGHRAWIEANRERVTDPDKLLEALDKNKFAPRRCEYIAHFLAHDRNEEKMKEFDKALSRQVREASRNLHTKMFEDVKRSLEGIQNGLGAASRGIHTARRSDCTRLESFGNLFDIGVLPHEIENRNTRANLCGWKDNEPSFHISDLIEEDAPRLLSKVADILASAHSEKFYHRRLSVYDITWRPRDGGEPGDLDVWLLHMYCPDTGCGAVETYDCIGCARVTQEKYDTVCEDRRGVFLDDRANLRQDPAKADSISFACLVASVLTRRWIQASKLSEFEHEVPWEYRWIIRLRESTSMLQVAEFLRALVAKSVDLDNFVLSPYLQEEVMSDRKKVLTDACRKSLYVNVLASRTDVDAMDAAAKDAAGKIWLRMARFYRSDAIRGGRSPRARESCEAALQCFHEAARFGNVDALVEMVEFSEQQGEVDEKWKISTPEILSTLWEAQYFGSIHARAWLYIAFAARSNDRFRKALRNGRDAAEYTSAERTVDVVHEQEFLTWATRIASRMATATMGFPENKELARGWLEVAARLGHSLATLELGRLLVILGKKEPEDGNALFRHGPEEREALIRRGVRFVAKASNNDGRHGIRAKMHLGLWYKRGISLFWHDDNGTEMERKVVLEDADLALRNMRAAASTAYLKIIRGNVHVLHDADAQGHYSGMLLSGYGPLQHRDYVTGMEENNKSTCGESAAGHHALAKHKVYCARVSIRKLETLTKFENDDLVFLETEEGQSDSFSHGRQGLPASGKGWPFSLRKTSQTGRTSASSGSDASRLRTPPLDSPYPQALDPRNIATTLAEAEESYVKPWNFQWRDHGQAQVSFDGPETLNPEPLFRAAMITRKMFVWWTSCDSFGNGEPSERKVSRLAFSSRKVKQAREYLRVALTLDGQKRAERIAQRGEHVREDDKILEKARKLDQEFSEWQAQGASAGNAQMPAFYE